MNIVLQPTSMTPMSFKSNKPITRAIVRKLDNDSVIIERTHINEKPKNLVEKLKTEALKYFKTHSNTKEELETKERIFNKNLKENKDATVDLLLAKDENGENLLSHKDVANILLRSDEFPLYDTDRILKAVEIGKYEDYPNRSMAAWNMLREDRV